MKNTSYSKAKPRGYLPVNQNKPHHGSRTRNNNLVTLVSSLGYAITFLSLTAQLSHSVILPPRLYIPSLHQGQHSAAPTESNELVNESDEPYVLSINEGLSESVPLNSKSFLTINLNRAIQQNISVIVSVYSGPDLIDFDTEKDPGIILAYSNYTPLRNASANYTIKYAANTFGDRIVNFRTNKQAGHAEIVCKIVEQPKGNITVDDSTAYISVDIYRDWNIVILIQVVGWIYFAAWSISFYFQFFLNYKRKSVVGLNFDFLALNLLGFTCYSVYNMSLLLSYNVQQEYYRRYTYSRIPVEYNDLFFALHALVITILTVIQCFIYERGEQQISLPAGAFLSLSASLGIGLSIASLFTSVSILDVVIYLSYVKLVITTIKYVPQAYMNYSRKATAGWSIHNIILDFTGGLFSLAQMLLIAYNYNDWISIFGNFAKFGLGLISMIFDLVFFVQHYVLYRKELPLVSDDLNNSTESVPSPVISQSIRSANTTQQQNPGEDSDEMTERDD